MDKLRQSDFLYSFFMAPGGSVIWIVRRQGEVFVNAILNMRQWVLFHKPFDAHEAVATQQIDAMTQLLNLMGFTEYPVYLEVRQADKNELVGLLRQQFDIFDKETEAAIKRTEEARKQQAAAEAQKPALKLEK